MRSAMRRVHISLYFVHVYICMYVYVCGMCQCELRVRMSIGEHFPRTSEKRPMYNRKASRASGCD